MATVVVPIRAKDETKKGVDAVEKRFAGLRSTLGAAVGVLGVTAGIGAAVGAVQAGVNAAADFETALTNISARVQLADDELESVRQTALDLGRDTKFSATEAAEGILELVTSGSTAEEALGTIPEVLNLAAAAGLELGAAADGVTDVMAQFRLGVQDANTVVNSFVAASGSSSATVADLVEGFKTGGAVASGFGLDVEQTAATLAVLAENGLKGAEAGTALKSFFLNATRGAKESEAALARLNTGFFNADGSARDFNVVIAEISQGLSGLSDQEANAVLKDLAGSYGQVAARALVASGGIDAMQEAMAGQRTAAEVAAEQLNTFQGRLDSLGSSLQTLAIQVFTPLIDNVLSPLISVVTQVVNAFADWAQTAEAVAIFSVFREVGAAVLEILTVLGQIALPFVQIAFQNLATFVGFVANGFLFLIGKVRDFVNFIYGILQPALGFLSGVLMGISSLLGGGVPAEAEAAEKALENVSTQAVETADELIGTMDAVEEVAEGVGAVAEGAFDAAAGISQASDENRQSFGRTATAACDAAAQANKCLSQIGNVGNKVRRNIKRNITDPMRDIGRMGGSSDPVRNERIVDNPPIGNGPAPVPEAGGRVIYTAPNQVVAIGPSGDRISGTWMIGDQGSGPANVVNNVNINTNNLIDDERSIAETVEDLLDGRLFG